MFHRIRIACYVLITAALCAVTQAQEMPADNQTEARRTRQLIADLGDASFQKRRNAARELQAMGLAALTSLKAAAEAEDLEIRYRAERLYQQIRLEVHEQRLKQFLVDPDSIDAELIPGLKRYREVVGDDEPARNLFVDMQREEAELFVQLEGDAKQLEELYEARAFQIRYLLTTPEARSRLPATTSALMFLGTLGKIEVSDQAVSMIYNLANYNEFRKELTAEPVPSPVRRVVAHWIATEKAGSAQQRLILALRYGLNEGIVPALAALKTQANAYEIQYALLTIGRFGSREHLPAVEKLFENKGLLSRIGGNGNAVQFTAEIRDVALAVAAHLVGQKPREEYGFSRISNNTQYLFNPNSAGFNDEASRAAAFKKWAEWREKESTQPVKAPTPPATP